MRKNQPPHWPEWEKYITLLFNWSSFITLVDWLYYIDTYSSLSNNWYLFLVKGQRNPIIKIEEMSVYLLKCVIKLIKNNM